MNRWADLAGRGLSHLMWGQTAADVAARIGGQVYLATPYSKRVVNEHGLWCHTGNVEAFWDSAEAALDLTMAGCSVVSPIVMAAAMLDLTKHNGELDPLDAAFGTHWCAPILAASDAVAVPDLPGWNESEGIWHEVTTALDRNKPVFMMMRAPK